MSDDTLTLTQDEAPSNVVSFTTEETAPAEAPAAEEPATDAPKQPASLGELIQNIDINGISSHDIITDLVAGIQQLAMRGTIALGLLERIAMRDAAEPAPETASEAEAPAEDTETAVS